MTELCGCGLEPKRMQLAYPFIDREPNMVFIEAVKGGKSRITVEKPLIIYKEPGKYTDEDLMRYMDIKSTGRRWI